MSKSTTAKTAAQVHDLKASQSVEVISDSESEFGDEMSSSPTSLSLKRKIIYGAVGGAALVLVGLGCKACCNGGGGNNTPAKGGEEPNGNIPEQPPAPVPNGGGQDGNNTPTKAGDKPKGPETTPGKTPGKTPAPDPNGGGQEDNELEIAKKAYEAAKLNINKSLGKEIGLDLDETDDQSREIKDHENIVKKLTKENQAALKKQNQAEEAYTKAKENKTRTWWQWLRGQSAEKRAGTDAEKDADPEVKPKKEAVAELAADAEKKNEELSKAQKVLEAWKGLESARQAYVQVLNETQQQQEDEDAAKTEKGFMAPATEPKAAPAGAQDAAPGQTPKK